MLKNIIIVFLFSLLVFVGYQNMLEPVKAASGSPCDLANTAGEIDIYFCINPFNGHEYYQNSYGMMIPINQEK